MYGKHFQSMYTGSMYGAGGHVFAVWGYCISHANSVDGSLELNPMMLANMLGEKVETIEAAIAYLSAPDARSRTKTDDGRRLMHEGGFQYKVVNKAVYQSIRNDEERREYNRIKKHEQREREKNQRNNQLSNNPSLTFNECQQTASVSISGSSSISGDGEPERKEVPPTPEPPKARTFKQWNREELLCDVIRNNTDELLTVEEAKDFADYWMEPTATGRSRMSLEKTWDTRRRMQTALKAVYEKQRGMDKSKDMGKGGVSPAALSYAKRRVLDDLEKERQELAGRRWDDDARKTYPEKWARYQEVRAKVKALKAELENEVMA